MTVSEIPKNDPPIDEVEPLSRMAEVLKRGRAKAGYTSDQLADEIGMSSVFLAQVENGTVILNADQCSQVAAVLGIDLDLMLDCARAWHNAMWKKTNDKPGVQATSMSAKVGSNHGSDVELEEVATQVLFQAVGTAKALRMTADKLMVQAKKLQNVLVSRGVLEETHVAMSGPPQAVDNMGETEEDGS